MIEIGKKYKEWTVLRRSDKKTSKGSLLYECQCKCGKIKLMPRAPLLNEIGSFMCYECATEEQTKKRIETSTAYDGLIDKKIGFLHVIKKLEAFRNERGRWQVMFECVCRCGFVYDVRADRLKRGTIVACKNCSIANLTCRFCGCRSHSPISLNLQNSECDLIGYCPRCDKYCCMTCSIDPAFGCISK